MKPRGFRISARTPGLTLQPLHLSIIYMTSELASSDFSFLVSETGIVTFSLQGGAKDDINVWKVLCGRAQYMVTVFC